MAIIRIGEMRELDEKTLGSRLSEVKKELYHELGQVASGGRSTNPGRIKELKRTVARIMTLVHEKKLGINKNVKKKMKGGSKAPEKKEEKREEPRKEEKKEEKK